MFEGNPRGARVDEGGSWGASPCWWFLACLFCAFTRVVFGTVLATGRRLDMQPSCQRWVGNAPTPGTQSRLEPFLLRSEILTIFWLRGPTFQSD